MADTPPDSSEGSGSKSTTDRTSLSRAALRRVNATRRFARETVEADPSTMPFLRAYAVGFAADFLPAFIKIILAASSGKKRRGRGELARDSTLKQLWTAVERGLSPRGLATAFGIAVGGAKWAEPRVEPLVRIVYSAVKSKVEAVRKGKTVTSQSGYDVKDDADAEQKQRDQEAFIKLASTYVAGTLASFVSISLLQSKQRQAKARIPPGLPVEQPGLDLGFSPYPAVAGPAANASVAPRPTVPIGGTTTFPPRVSQVIESPTLDLTLFVFVRAADVFVRYLYEVSAVAKGPWGKFVEFFAARGDALVFWASCWRIMFCWFYHPNRLPPSYNRWILALARMNPGLLRLLQFARNGTYVYGQTPNAEVTAMCDKLAKDFGRDLREVLPDHITRLDCSFVHATVGAGSCESNAVKRWVYAFRDCTMIYLPVHLVPQLLFNWKAIAHDPAQVATRVVLGASRSSAFLATFVASIYAAVCLVRSRLPLVMPNVPQQFWDSGACVSLGCFVCGLSVLIENKRRRKEMALYVAPRALYATMEEIVPAFLQRGKVGQFITNYIERAIFAASTGTVIAATVHRPDLVSGVVKGVAGLAIGDWGRAVSKQQRTK